MTKPFLPYGNHALIISWSHMETAMRMMAAPGKQPDVKDMIDTIQKLYLKEGPEKAVFSLFAGIAWLTTDDQGDRLGHALGGEAGSDTG